MKEQRVKSIMYDREGNLLNKDNVPTFMADAREIVEQMASLVDDSQEELWAAGNEGGKAEVLTVITKLLIKNFIAHTGATILTIQKHKNNPKVLESFCDGMGAIVNAMEELNIVGAAVTEEMLPGQGGEAS